MFFQNGKCKKIICCKCILFLIILFIQPLFMQVIPLRRSVSFARETWIVQGWPCNRRLIFFPQMTPLWLWIQNSIFIRKYLFWKVEFIWHPRTYRWHTLHVHHVLLFSFLPTSLYQNHQICWHVKRHPFMHKYMIWECVMHSMNIHFDSLCAPVSHQWQSRNFTCINIKII